MRAFLSREKVQFVADVDDSLGFVYTRIFSKVMRAMSSLQAYEAEAQALEALLGQKRWRRGKRARWYERRAVLQTRYLCYAEGRDGKEKDFSVLQQAMEGVKEALQDEDTGLSEQFLLFGFLQVSS